MPSPGGSGASVSGQWGASPKLHRPPLLPSLSSLGLQARLRLLIKKAQERVAYQLLGINRRFLYIFQLRERTEKREKLKCLGSQYLSRHGEVQGQWAGLFVNAKFCPPCALNHLDVSRRGDSPSFPWLPRTFWLWAHCLPGLHFSRNNAELNWCSGGKVPKPGKG